MNKIRNQPSWTEQEDILLKSIYKNYENKELINYFSNRTLSAIENRIAILNLNKGKFVRWLSEEDEILIKNYAKIKPKELYSLFPNRSVFSVKGRISELRKEGLIKETVIKDWTKEEDEVLIQYYAKGTVKIREILPRRTKCAIVYRAKILGLTSEFKFGQQVYFHNKSFWSIPNETNCYWAGVIGCDGHLSIRNNYYALNYQVCKKDEDMMRNFVKDIEFTGNIFKSKTYMEKYDRWYPCVGVWIGCANNLFRDLDNNFNINENKSKLQYGPPLSGNLMWRFINGILDGDGCLSATHYLKENSWRVTLKVDNSNSVILDWLKSVLDAYFPIKTKRKLSLVRKRKNANAYIYAISGYRAVQIFNFLNSIEGFKLKRKWENPKFLEAVRYFENKFPEITQNKLNISPSLAL